ncbi:MAG: hypothetical protein PUD92_01995 [Clostridiales bacterium]|nr:hypothetical protein [Clostridiales bacterium]
MTKKFLTALALMVPMGISAVNPVSFAAGENTSAQIYSEVYSCDFESNQELTMKSAVLYESGIETDAFSGNNFYRIKKIAQDVAPVAAEIVLDNPIQANSGKCLISFDINVLGLTGSDHLVSLKAYPSALGANDIPDSTGATLNVIKASTDPMLCSYAPTVTGEGWWSTYCAIGADGGAATSNALLGTWFNVKAVVDTTEGTADYYFGDTWVGCARSDELKKGISTLQIQSWQGWNGFGEMYVDNISVCKEVPYSSGFAGVDTVKLSGDRTTVTFDGGTVLDSVTDVTLLDEISGETVIPTLEFDSAKITAVFDTPLDAAHIYTVSLTDGADINVNGVITFMTSSDIKEDVTQMISYDFEDGTLPSSFGASDIVTVNKDAYDNTNTVMEMCADSPAEGTNKGITLSLGDNKILPASGKYVLDYDIKYFIDGIDKYPLFYLVGRTPNGTDLAMNVIREWPGIRSKLGYSTNFNWWDSAETLMNPKDGEWMNIRIEIDTDNNIADYYFDNVYAGSQSGISAGTGENYTSGIDYFIFETDVSDLNYIDLYIDNISLKKVTKGSIASTGVKICDASGNVITDFTAVAAGDTLRADYALVNTLGTAQTADIILAVYNNGVLSDVQFKTVSAADFFTKDSISFTVQNTDGLSVKGFVWDSTGGMTPVSKY